MAGLRAVDYVGRFEEARMPSRKTYSEINSEREETRALWNRVADDWRIQVGDDGDGNRILNSDPVLWAFAGDVNGRTVLDAGCGTGYLSKKLRDRGALVTGIDFSERMIAIPGLISAWIPAQSLRPSMMGTVTW
jgi:2-polyprenyl-3-methyl-5-hydroxy-6-metoxy-1,4-benzoquinol methylase